MGSFGITELLIILVIVMVLFGTSKMKNMGSDLGQAIKGFRKAVTNNDEESRSSSEETQQSAPENSDSAAKKNDKAD